MNPALLLTGGSGFLSNVIQKELRGIFSICALGRNPINTLNYDLSNEIPKLIKGCPVVVHAAGKAHVVPKTESEKRVFYQVNFQGTQNL